MELFQRRFAKTNAARSEDAFKAKLKYSKSVSTVDNDHKDCHLSEDGKASGTKSGASTPSK